MGAHLEGDPAVPLSGPARAAADVPDRSASVAFRPELQGLRGLAVALVVVYHVWFDRVSGGVDVFFVLTGFLLTTQLLRAAARGQLNLWARWSRSIVRLVPTASVVLVITAAAAAVTLPEGRWPQTLREVLAAALFLENWRLAADSVDYLARNNMASVVQHFWSLSIQAQFLLVWPLVVAVVAARRTGQLHRQLTATTGVVLVASLAYSVHLTATNQPLAYFHSLTRLWELAVGALLALSIDRVRLEHRWRLVAGWVGAMGLVLCGLVLPGGAVFPGIAALWPTGCAVLVLLAGTTGDARGVDRWLGRPGVQRLGDLSFSLYLWHWPVLVLYLVGSGREQVGLPAGVAIIGGSLLLAHATHRWVERPLLRRHDSRSGVRTAAVGLLCVALVVAGWQAEVLRRTVPSGTVGDELYPGAMALAAAAPRAAPVLPPPVSVYEDWVRIEYWDCAPLQRFPMDACAQPVEAEPRKRVVIAGDSHLQQLSGALIPLAHEQGWQLVTMVRGACPFSTSSEVDRGDAECLAWNAAVAEEIAELRPDAVVTLASRDVRAGRTEQTPPGFVEQWRRLTAAGIPVLAIRDNPRFDTSMPDCVQQARSYRSDATEPSPCGAPRHELYGHDPPWTARPDVPAGVTFLDIADAVCDAEFCPAEIGNVLVYLDDNHVSASYSTSMAPLLRDRVLAALGE